MYAPCWTSCPAAVTAGIDMFMAPEDWRELLENTIEQKRIIVEVGREAGLSVFEAGQ